MTHNECGDISYTTHVMCHDEVYGILIPYTLYISFWEGLDICLIQNL